MERVFQFVYLLLVQGAHRTGLTYHEINIVVYYMVVPMLYLALLDWIMKRHLLKIGYACVILLTVLAVDFDKFSTWLFDLSVRFLLMFQVVGWNYTVASVVVCVVVPLAVFVVLCCFAFTTRARNNSGRTNSTTTEKDES